MRRYSLAHLADQALLRKLSALVAQDRVTTADLLAHLAEIDARRLYLAAGYSSMFAYCVEALHLSEDVTCKRVQAARAARAHPALFAAVADGRLHLAAVCLIAPHLDTENVEELVAAASHRSKAQVERMLAERFMGPAQMEIVPVAAPAAAPVGAPAGTAPAAGRLDSPGESPPLTLASVPTAAPVEPRLVVRLSLPLSTQDKLRRAQALLSHAVPSGDAAEILDRALDALLTQLERRKHGARRKPRERAQRDAARTPNSPRHIPAHVKRAVWARDQGRCSFVNASGRQCSSTTRLEFDHVDPVARGGRGGVDRLRLLCRAHNQFEAERVYGAGFMRRKRAEARERSSTRSTCPGAGDDVARIPSG